MSSDKDYTDLQERLAKVDAALEKSGMRKLEQEIEAAIARGECNYWDTWDADGKLVKK